MPSHLDPDKAQPLTARKSAALKGIAPVPGDKSISQRALILGGMAEGETRISGLLESEDVLNTAAAVGALGATALREGVGAWRVTGVGARGWRQPEQVLDFGNSGTGSRLMMGAVATTPIRATFTGDASLRSRPMARVLDPLTRFGTRYEAQGDKALMPLTVIGAGSAPGIACEVTVASAQVKSALLLAACHAKGESRIAQKALTRDHTEKMLAGFGASIHVESGKDGGEIVHLQGPARLKGCAIEVPRDPSSAAFPLVAALIVPGSEILLPAILLNPRRTGLIETLLEMGADIRIENRRDSGGEEIGDLRVRHSALKGVTVPVQRAPAMIDEYPILAVAAAFAEGATVMQGLEELRVKESDRLSAIARGLQANGVSFRETDDGLTVTGGKPVPGGGMVATHMDHRIAMAFLTLGLAAENPVTVDDVTMIATSFPEYQTLMRTLGAQFDRPAP
jgi:3-phosphoshikimate 1-carboxyvinyltransferase